MKRLLRVQLLALGALSMGAPGIAQTAKLYLGAVAPGNAVYRYEVEQGGAASLDLTLVHPTFAVPGFFAFSPAGEMFVVSHGAGVSSFLDPQDTPMFNLSIDASFFITPLWAGFRGEELLVSSLAGELVRFLFDASGYPVANGTIPVPADVRAAEVNPDTGELFVSLCCSSNRIDRFIFDSLGNAIPNGSIVGGGISNPHDMVFSPWGELFVVNGGNHTVSRFTFNAMGDAVPGVPISGGVLSVPLGADFSPWGELFVANRNDGWVSRFLFDASLNAISNGGFQHVAAIHDLEFATGATQVEIDIKPGSSPNCFNVNGHGVIPVAILGAADFDATQVDVGTLVFAGLEVRVRGNGAPQCSVEDVSGYFLNGSEGEPDGFDDLVCQFVDDPESWEPAEDEACVTGDLLDGTDIEGCDSICITQ